MSSPKVFVSYSHDGPAHKQWVLELAIRLRQGGVDAILDQWDLKLGEDISRFMESGIQDCERVVVVLSNQYVEKANEGVGGVGYERQIVTAQLIQDLGTTKFIPIIRGNPSRQIPGFLGYRAYLDFTDDVNYDLHLDVLLREIHQVPPSSRPPVGPNPFSAESVSVASPAEEGTGPKTSAARPPDTQTLRRLIEVSASTMALHDWLVPRAQRVRADLEQTHLGQVGASPTAEEFVERVTTIESVLAPLLVELAVAGRWADGAKFATVLRAVSRLEIEVATTGSFYEAWMHLARYPLLLAATATGFGAIVSEDYGKLRELWDLRLPETSRERGPRVLIEALHKGAPFAQDVWRWLPGQERAYFPVSARLQGVLAPIGLELQLTEKELEEALDRYEFYQALQYVALAKRSEQFGGWAPLGAFVWRRTALSTSTTEDINRLAERWGPITAGLFGGTVANASETLANFVEFVGRVRAQRGMH